MEAVSRAAERVRAIGLIRVSEPGERSGETFRSPRDQRAIIEHICAEHGWQPAYWMEGLGLSGMLPLDKRSDLLASLGLIQAGQAQVLVSAYYDRMWRKTRVGEDVLDLLEAAGCRVFAGDLGEITRRTAASRFQLRVLGAANELVAESAAEKTMHAKQDAVARGVAPFPTLVAGYRRGAAERIEPDPVTAPLVAQAFQLRADGATITQVRDFLRASGVRVPAQKRSKDGTHRLIPIDHQRTRTLLRSRLVLGELRHGAFVNPHSHPAIVSHDLWQRVQRTKVARGRQPSSDRLLARLGVLRCATCGRPLSVGGYFSRATGARTATYRCAQPDRACPAPAQINATTLEDLVVARVRELLAAESESASVEANVAAAEAELSRTQALLDAAVAAFDGVDVASARQRLLELQAAVQVAADEVSRLRAAAAPALELNASRDWAALMLDERRALIRATLRTVTVAPGRGSARVTLQTFGE